MTYPVTIIKIEDTAQGCRYILWNCGNDYYEIDCVLGPNRTRRIVNLFDTKLEQAIEKFNEIIKEAP
jgi:hypothetical protein